MDREQRPRGGNGDPRCTRDGQGRTPYRLAMAYSHTPAASILLPSVPLDVIYDTFYGNGSRVLLISYSHRNNEVGLGAASPPVRLQALACRGHTLWHLHAPWFCLLQHIA